MPISDPNRERLILVAETLGSLRERVVFLGGSVLGLLITDEGAPPIRTTKDVDCIVEVATKMEFLRFEQELQAYGFVHDPAPKAPRCRYVIKTQQNVKLDVVPTDESIIGFGGGWAASAVEFPVSHVLQEGLAIEHISAPYFVAAKLEAFRDRGEGDRVMSRDIEDVIAVIDGRPAVVAEIGGAEAALREYLHGQFSLWGSQTEDIVQSHLPGDAASQRRVPIVAERLRQIIAAYSTAE